MRHCSLDWNYLRVQAMARRRSILPDKTGRVSAMKELSRQRRLTSTYFGGAIQPVLGAVGGLGKPHSDDRQQIAIALALQLPIRGTLILTNGNFLKQGLIGSDYQGSSFLGNRHLSWLIVLPPAFQLTIQGAGAHIRSCSRRSSAITSFGYFERIGSCCLVALSLAARTDYWGRQRRTAHLRSRLVRRFRARRMQLCLRIMSTTYGTGDGSTTFNLPNKTGSVSAMKDSSATRLTSTYFFGGTSTNFGCCWRRGKSCPFCRSNPNAHFDERLGVVVGVSRCC